jgi:hypothetical protein
MTAADWIAAGFVIAGALTLLFFALRIHARATSPTSQPSGRNVVDARTSAARARNIFTTWQDGRRG